MSPTAALTDDTQTRGRPSNSLHFSIGEISGKLDQLLINVLPRLTNLEEADQMLEGRIAGIEKWQARLIGGGAVVVFLFTGFEVFRYVLQF